MAALVPSWLDYASAIYGYFLTIDWATLAKTASGAGIGTTLVLIGERWLVARWERQRKATHLARRLVRWLDEFGLACQEEVADRQDGGYQSVGLPSLPPCPDDIEGWRSLRNELAMKCERFPGHVRETKSLIDFEHREPSEDFVDTIDETTARLGLEAHSLAEDLCRAYGLSIDDEGYVSWLKSELGRVARNREWRRAAPKPKAWPR